MSGIELDMNSAMLGVDVSKNPYNPVTEPAKHTEWNWRQAAKEVAREKREEAKTAKTQAALAKKIAKGGEATSDDSGTNPLVIAALVIGGGALLYFIFKKGR